MESNGTSTELTLSKDQRPALESLRKRITYKKQLLQTWTIMEAQSNFSEKCCFSSSEICEHDLKMTLPDKLEVYQNTVSCDLDKGYMKKLHQKNYLQ